MWYYQYDALGRRISKACPQQQLKITYLWDGDQLAYTQTVKQNKLVSQRHSVFHGWQLIAQQDRYQQSQQTLDSNKTEWKHETHYTITQPNGKVLGLLSPEGKLKWKDEKRSVWGLLFPNDYRKTSPLDPQFLFAGQYTDQESGLAYNRFRYYDPESGNYISSDPIGLSGGEQPYRYVHNVLDFLDPFGLAGCSTTLGKNMMESMGLSRSTSWAGHQAHHIIPVQLINHPALKKLGYNIDEAANGIFLRTVDDKVSAMSRHQGNHDGYTRAIKDALDKIDLNGDIAKQVSQIQEMARKGLSNGMPIRALDLHPSGGILGNNRAYQLWSKILN
ncbi:AHH domain-containing protein [Pasteurella sp. PK-2025]|uniref:AHH domain-containing protein n=1 Tax=Pasteurella sp. PK-2025 TaxID=3413133 RepID=UPI003C7934B5